MKDQLGLAPVPRSVERNLSRSVLGNQVRAQVALACQPARSPDLVLDPIPVRLAESDVAEELACLLDIERPDVASWSTQMTGAIEQTFARDMQRRRTALHGLDVVIFALTQGPPGAREKALAEFDSLLLALCVGSEAGARTRG